MNNEEIRREARELLKDKWLNLALIWLILYAISAVLTSVTSGIGGVIPLILAGPFSLGIAMIFLKLRKGGDFRVEEMFDGFKEFTRSMVAYLLIALYVFLWSLLLIVPGIIACISYSMTFFILAEDPKIEAQEAMRRSKEMMHGHKTEYFMLMLSFIGWFLLSCLTFGLGFLLLSSYMTMASAIFYGKIKEMPLRQEQPETIQTPPNM